MKILPAASHTDPQPVRLLIYAHFDPENVIQEYVLHTLRSMSTVCSEIRVVSTSVLADSERAKIRPYVQEILEVANIGLDFNMWKCALKTIAVQDYDELVIMNSSVYGPLFEISKIFVEMQTKECDYWGMTESYDPDWHLQSYFIVFRKSVLSSEAFKLFWDSVLPYKNKNQVIRSYEIGLSQWLANNGFSMYAYCSWTQLTRYLAAHPEKSIIFLRNMTTALRLRKMITKFILRNLHRVRITPVNPSVALPEEALALNMPFLKLVVLRENPYGRDIIGIMNALKAANYPKQYLLTDRPPAATDGIATSHSAICPICGHAGDILYTGLSDRFGVNNPKGWGIRKCRSRRCGCAWLDPAPLESEVYKAYRNYYTHQGGSSSLPYYPPNYGRIENMLLEISRRCLHYTHMNSKRETHRLHGLEKGQGRLLEVGCGDGARLAALKECGWNVEGQEVDPKAVSNCNSKGFVVHKGDIDQLGLPENTYDVILVSHVIEHIHLPVEFLSHCRKLLKPRGRLVLSTPNIESFGHWVYKRSWLHLDPPRHLVIYNRRSLVDVFHKAGFTRISIKTVALNCELSSMHSRDIKYFGWTDMNSMPRVGKEFIPVLMQLAALILQFIRPGAGEECFAIAEKDT